MLNPRLRFFSKLHPCFLSVVLELRVGYSYSLAFERLRVLKRVADILAELFPCHHGLKVANLILICLEHLVVAETIESLPVGNERVSVLEVEVFSSERGELAMR